MNVANAFGIEGLEVVKLSESQVVPLDEAMNIRRLLSRGNDLFHDRKASRVSRVHGHEIHNALFPLNASGLFDYVLCSLLETVPLSKLACKPRVGVSILNNLGDS